MAGFAEKIASKCRSWCHKTGLLGQPGCGIEAIPGDLQTLLAVRCTCDAFKDWVTSDIARNQNAFDGRSPSAIDRSGGIPTALDTFVGDLIASGGPLDRRNRSNRHS